MSLTICPECAHEVSSTAKVCPNCGRPFAPVAPKVIVQEIPAEREDFPKWIFIPLGIFGALLLVILLVWMRNGNDDEAQRNINVRIAQQPVSGEKETTTTVRNEPPPPSQVIVPSTSQPTEIVVPQSAPPPSSTTVTNVPSEPAAPDKGTVNLEAKILPKNGGSQPVRAEKFYLLDKDLDSILNEAGITDETGQGLRNAFGLSVVYPNQYGDTNRKALNAIQKHIVYRTLTDSSGKAEMKDVKPDSYYLFAITKSGGGFAIWSSPVSVVAGKNELVLEPLRPTEITK